MKPKLNLLKTSIVFKYLQCPKLTFSKSRLLATFNCKMVAIKKFSRQKQKNAKGRAPHDILHIAKKREGEDTSWRITRRANVPNGTFSTIYFAAVSLRIHVEFLNDERGKEKDRWCCCLYYWLNSSLTIKHCNRTKVKTITVKNSKKLLKTFWKL